MTNQLQTNQEAIMQVSFQWENNNGGLINAKIFKDWNHPVPSVGDCVLNPLQDNNNLDQWRFRVVLVRWELHEPAGVNVMIIVRDKTAS